MVQTRRTWSLIAVALATFMTYLDNNIVNVALPDMQRDLGLTTAGLEWVVSGYVLTFAGLLLLGGRLADTFGRRRLFLVGLAVFTAASLVAGLAGTPAILIAARAVQGLGAALVTPTTLAIISHSYTDTRERAAAIGIWGAVGGLALAAGPLLGGVLTQHASWHWIFILNVPIGAAVLALGSWAITESKAERERLDLPGIVSSGVALVALTWALIEGSSRGWTDPAILGAFGLAVVALAVFIPLERRPGAMVDVRLFTDRFFTGGIVAVMLWAFGLFGIYFFTSLYLQNVLGFSATRAGLAFVPMALLMVAGAATSDKLAARFGSQRLVTLAMFLMAAGIATVALVGQHAVYVDLMPSFALIGIGGGLSMPLTASVLSAMPAERAGVASGIFNAARELAGLLGITIIGAVLSARRSASIRNGHDPLTAYLSGYRLGLLVAGALVLSGAVASWFALRPRPVLEGEPVTETERVLVAA